MSDKKTQEKHAAPLSCRVWVSVFGVSPSALCGFCSFGCKWQKKKCVGCRHNRHYEYEEVQQYLHEMLNQHSKRQTESSKSVESER